MVLLGLLVVACFRRLRSRLFHRLMLLGLGLLAVILIVVPDLSTKVAELAGVGRGADLVIYLGFVGVAFALAVLYLRLRATEERLTEVVRSIAILNAQDTTQEGERMRGFDFGRGWRGDAPFGWKNDKNKKLAG
jgi:hypothetical protein